MARSWRNFFKRDSEEPAESGVATQTEAPDGNGTAPSEDEVPAAEEVLAERREPEVVEAPVEEAKPGEVEEALPEPGVVEEAPDAEAAAEAQEAGGWFGRLRQGLSRSRESVVGQLNAAVAEFRDAEDEEFWERVEEILIASDVGVTTTSKLVRELEQEALEKNLTNGEELRALLIDHATRMLEGPVELDVSHDPTVILMVGVNGTGKTTTCAKLAHYTNLQGKKAMLGACDTFRAAAIEQLKLWGNRLNVPVIASAYGADAAAVAHDAVTAALARKADYLFIDTAGRLHTKSNLMQELQKLHRVIGKQMPGAPHEVLLVLDATTGMNALTQAREFHKAVTLTGLVITKLDGTSKGGMVAAIGRELNVPVKFVGLGEQADDLQPFDPASFASALFPESETTAA